MGLILCLAQASRADLPGPDYRRLLKSPQGNARWKWGGTSLKAESSAVPGSQFSHPFSESLVNMSANGSKSLPSIGFLAVIDTQDLGLVGGYLVLNATGRPLEFHCTAPVKANRAQQILYGPTLAPFLYGEQIGQTLLAKAKLQPLLVCTDVTPALAVREFVDFPVALVLPATPEGDADTGTQSRIDAAHASVPVPKSARLHEFSLGGQRLAVAAAYEHDGGRIAEAWHPYAENFDLIEPFGRIREALEEAQRGAK